MSNEQSNNNQPAPFFYALLDEVSMLEERSSHTPIEQKGSNSQKTTLRINNSVGFQIGLDDPANPKNILIELDFSLEIFLDNTDIQVATYSSKHAVEFTVTKWFGFDSWADLPDDCVNVYFAIVHNIAKSRAESTLIAMGLKGVRLDKYDYSNPLEKESDAIK